jgi:hypothetical protein
MPNTNTKNPFNFMSPGEADFIYDENEWNEEKLNEEIWKLIQSLKGYYKHKFYQKLYYINENFKKSKEPFIISKRSPSKKVDGKIIISFD